MIQGVRRHLWLQDEPRVAYDGAFAGNQYYVLVADHTMAHGRILIVEDENVTGLDIRRTLQEFGYEPVGPVASGKEAIEHALTHHPDVILMDIFLRGPIDGIETAQTIQSQYRCPVIYLTAHSDDSTIDRAKVTEPFGYLLKPVNDQELRIAIEMALYRHGEARRDSVPVP